MSARLDSTRRTLARLIRAALVLSFAGCPSAPIPIPDDIPIVDDQVLQLDAEPACIAEVDEWGTVTINGRDTGLVFDYDYMGSRVRTWPFVGGSVLVANWPYWEVQGGAWTDGVLYKVVCATATPHELVSLPDADFGSASLDAGNVTLYFTGPTGVAALDLETLEIEELTTAPSFVEVDCWTEQGERDVVAGLDGHELIIHRGAGCGYEGDWVARELRLDLDKLRSGGDATPYSSYPVATVAVDADGTLWLGNGTRCDEPGVRDPQTTGAVLRSTDEGDTWDVIRAVDADREETMHSAASQILADRDRPGHLLVRSTICSSGAAVIGGSAYLTRDGGSSWQRLSLPEDQSDIFDLGQGVLWVELIDGKLEQIRVVVTENYEGTSGSAWETYDGGETWLELDTVPSYSPEPVVAEFGDTQWRGTPAGLERSAGDDVTLVYPGAVFVQSVVAGFRTRWGDDPRWALEGANQERFRVVTRGEELTLFGWEDVDGWFNALADNDEVPSFGETLSCEGECCTLEPEPDWPYVSRVCVAEKGGWYAIESIEIE